MKICWMKDAGTTDTFRLYVQDGNDPKREHNNEYSQDPIVSQAA